MGPPSRVHFGLFCFKICVDALDAKDGGRDEGERSISDHDGPKAPSTHATSARFTSIIERHASLQVFRVRGEKYSIARGDGAVT